LITIYGYIGDDLFAGPIQNLLNGNDDKGPAVDLVSKITSIEIVGSIASVKMESKNWTGHKFADFFNRLKVD
jgi:hypothetical protein